MNCGLGHDILFSFSLLVTIRRVFQNFVTWRVIIIIIYVNPYHRFVVEIIKAKDDQSCETILAKSRSKKNW